MALNDIHEVRIVTSLLEQIAINVLHYRVNTVTAVEPTLAEYAFRMNSWASSNWKGVMAAAAAYRGVGVRKVWPPPISIEVANVGSPGPGTLGLDVLPHQTSGLVTIKTAVAGRGGRGRIYMPFPAVDQNNPDGTPTAEYAANIQGAVSLFLGGLSVVGVGGSSTTLPVVWNRKSGVGTPWALTIGQKKWATQRRRGQYGRPNLLPF